MRFCHSILKTAWTGFIRCLDRTCLVRAGRIRPFRVVFTIKCQKLINPSRGSHILFLAFFTRSHLSCFILFSRSWSNKLVRGGASTVRWLVLLVLAGILPLAPRSWPRGQGPTFGKTLTQTCPTTLLHVAQLLPFRVRMHW
jgi:hypothetical protein